ncbi:MAG: hypothetical protein P1P87_00445 [Trueperaceae bacterium]|nr:hypothetical protein [Trueperaceae bacterium]
MARSDGTNHGERDAVRAAHGSLARLGWGLLVAAVLAACAQQPPPPTAAITEVRATSSTSLAVAFDAPVHVVEPSAFAIRDPNGAALDVVALHPRPDGRSVVLGTAPQQAVAYRLSVSGVVTAGTLQPLADMSGDFTGSLAPAPIVGSAVAISPTQVVVSFHDPATGTPAELGPSAEDADQYRLTDSALDLEVSAAAFGSDFATVVLTTAPQFDVTYTLDVAAVFSRVGERLVDPFNNRTAVRGIAANDTRSPSVDQASSLGATAVSVRFSEPVRDEPGGAGDPASYGIVDAGGESLPVIGVELNAYRTAAVLTTGRSQVDGRAYTLTVRGVRDDAGNALDPDPSDAVFFGQDAPVGVDTTAPRVANVGSTSNTSVVVTFSEPVLGGPSSAENPVHYRIYSNDATADAIGPSATLIVLDAQLDATRTSVTLTTSSQSDLGYVLEVVNVRDLAGNQIAPPERGVLPSVQGFRGTAPAPGELVDSDGDGLSDDVEQRGWTVRVTRLDGTVEAREVTSDPFTVDTDGDGMTDAEERQYGIDPRNPDTDGDAVTDFDELNAYYSEPALEDTDGDGLSDGLEVGFFRTSPLLADTDGDQFDDGAEATTDNRNPRIADLPRVDIRVGTVDLRLDVRFEEQTASGTRTLDARSVDSTLTQSQESAQARETSSTLEWFVQGEATVCTYGGCEEGKEGGFKFTAAGGASGSSTTTFSNASVSATQREYATSLATEAEVTAESVVTRVVEGATMAVEVNLANTSNIAFTISNIEITALLQDPRDPSVFVPVATLLSATGEPINIGPLTPERGPFRFATDSAYPALVESLMANPRGLIFRVANYDLVDEFGRNFAFVEQDVNDRTAFLEINYAGNQALERFQVATNGTFDAFGRPSGITFAQVMEEVLGLAYVDEATDLALDPSVRADADLLDASYSTRTVNGVDTLWRVKRVSRELTGQERDWWVLGPQGNITPVGTRPGLDFRDVVLFADQDFALAFVQDLDQDDLEAIEEGFYRSLDSAADVDPANGVPDSRDSDRDGIADADEVYGPFTGNRRIRWLVGLEDGRDAYATMAHPGRADTDGDGLTDCQELLVAAACSAVTVYLDANGVPTIAARSSSGVAHTLFGTVTLLARTDPSSPDTDGDGLTDLQEAIGFQYRTLARTTATVLPRALPTGAALPTGVLARFDATTPYATNPLAVDSDRDGLDDILEVRLGSNPLLQDGDSVRDADADGLVNLVETTGWSVTVRAVGGASTARTVTSDPQLVDTDGDGLTDWEENRGCRDANRDRVCDDDRRWGPTDPRASDTDADGLTDRTEVDGAPFPSDTTSPVRFTNPLFADSDADGRNDGAEVNLTWQVVVAGRGGYTVWSDPLRADRDGDGLNDASEFTQGTDPNLADTDGDGALDALEANPARPTSPLVPDHLVTVTYLSLQAGKGTSNADSDGDAGQDPGDFRFSFQVRVPNAAGGLDGRQLASHNTVTVPGCATANQDLCRNNGGGDHWIQIASPRTLYMSESSTFAVPYTALFTIEGFVQEIDNELADASFFFGGIGDPSGVYAGTDLRKGSFSVNFSGAPDGVVIDVNVLVTVQ